MASILIFSDEREVFDILAHLLQDHGHKVRVMSGSNENLPRVKHLVPDIVMVDSDSDIAATRLCREMRSQEILKSVRIMLFSKLPANRISPELRDAVDHHMTRPVKSREVLRHVNTLAARTPPAQPKQILESCGIVIDPDGYTATRLGCTIRLTLLECRLLHFLASHPNEVHRRDRLLVSVWDNENVTLRTVDACVRNLRKKLRTEPTSAIGIQSIRGQGYLWRTATDFQECLPGASTEIQAGANAISCETRLVMTQV